jgi:hypothetical protein
MIPTPTMTPDIWLAISSDGVDRTVDAGHTWRPAQDFNKNDSSFRPTGLIADPRRPGVLWVAGDHFLTKRPDTFTPQIYRSSDYGRTWASWLTGYSVVLPDPRRNGAAWLANGQTVAWTGDDGRTIEAIGQIGSSADAPINSLAFDGAHPRGLFAATAGTGAFHSLDGGEHWNPINAGLPGGGQVAISEFLADAAHPGRVWAALATGGLWRGDFSDP